MGRAPCCEKVGLNRGPWTREEDMRLIQYIQSHGGGCWRTLPKAAGLLRCGKSCRLRWINYLRPDLKRGNISEEEDRLIIKLHSMLGNRWSLIAGRLPGRTDNEIKNYWNTHLKKKLRSMGIDPQTHKPISGDTTNSIAVGNKPLAAADDQPMANNINTDTLITPNQLNTCLMKPTNQLNKPTNQFSKPINQLSIPANQLSPSTNHLPIPTNRQINHKSRQTSLLNFRARPLDIGISFYSSISATSLVHSNHAIACTSPLADFLDVTSASLVSPLSAAAATSSSMDCNTIPQFFSMLGQLPPKPHNIDILNTSVAHSYSASCNQSPCLPMPSTLSPITATPSPSSSLPTSYSSSSSSPIDAQPSEASKDNKCYAYMEDTKDATLIEQDDNVETKIFLDNIDNKNGGSNEEDDMDADQSLMTECDLSLIEGELMWDIEMIHSFQEVGTPTTSSMSACSSPCNLWGHDVAACCDNASPQLQAWLNVGNDQ